MKMSLRTTETQMSHGLCDLTCDEGIITADCYNLTSLYFLIWSLIKLKALRISSTNREEVNFTSTST